MSSEARTLTLQSCRHCGAGAPVDVHFCPQCERILTLARHGDYFSFFGLPRKLGIDLDDLEQRFRTLSRQFHPDYFYTASAAGASGQPRARVVSQRRLPGAEAAARPGRVPAQGRRAAERGPAPGRGGAAGGRARGGVRAQRRTRRHPRRARGRRLRRASCARGSRRRDGRSRSGRPARKRSSRRCSQRWDKQVDEEAPADVKRATLESLRSLLQERSYIANLIAATNRERGDS